MLSCIFSGVGGDFFQIFVWLWTPRTLQLHINFSNMNFLMKGHKAARNRNFCEHSFPKFSVDLL